MALDLLHCMRTKLCLIATAISYQNMSVIPASIALAKPLTLPAILVELFTESVSL